MSAFLAANALLAGSCLHCHVFQQSERAIAKLCLLMRKERGDTAAAFREPLAKRSAPCLAAWGIVGA
jgi:hypothetical protein